MKQTEKKYQCIPFWSWNDELAPKELCKQIEWMYENGVGGFFMHARGGLKTEYLGEKWFECIKACSELAEQLGMEAYAYDENGWPSGFVGGKLLEDIENHDRYLTFGIGTYDEKALVSYDISGEKLIRVTGGEHCLNVYQHYAASTADILNGEVVDQFISMTHEEYKKRDTYHLKGFFTDEPQYYRWDTPYTKVLPKYFLEEYKEDIFDGLGLLFVEKQDYRAFRYKYWKAMQALMLKNFAEKIYMWCDQNGYKLTGHYVEERFLGTQMWCCGGIMPFYEYEHIPGIDWLSRGSRTQVSQKQVSSVAAQLGKRQVISETYGCCGWDVTPQELKEIAESQYVGGVNLMCQHLLPYTEHGQRKRDYPAHYSPVNPWVRKNFKQFNDYFSYLGKILAESDEVVNVAMLHPIRSAYFNYKRYESAKRYCVGELENAFLDATNLCIEKQIPFHYLDETLLAKYGSVQNGKLVLGKCAYDFIIFPKIYTMDKSTEKLLHEFVNAGGRVLLTDEKPEYREGEEFTYDYLSTNVTWEEIIAVQPFTAAQHPDVRTTYRVDKDGKKFIYAVNLGEKTVVDFSVQGATSFSSYDILKDEFTVIPTRVPFDKGQSYVLYLSNEKPVQNRVLKSLHLDKMFTVCNKPKNYLTIDMVSYSKDGKEYSEPMYHLAAFDAMLHERYQGKLYLKYTFNVDEISSKCTLLAEDTNTLSVKVNGEAVQPFGCSEIEKALLRYDIVHLLRKGKNEIIIEINYYQSEQVYYALFGENVTESLKNCLAYDTDIEAIYLEGDFGVYGDLAEGNAENVLVGENFRMGRQKEQISCLITDGFPFFSGDIILKQTVFAESADYELYIDKRFHILDVKVNGTDIGRLMFGNRIDLSKGLKAGENEIVITLTVGNRNLLGPFHTKEQEPLSVGPHTFERMNTWIRGKSDAFVEKYAFVKTLI